MNPRTALKELEEVGVVDLGSAIVPGPEGYRVYLRIEEAAREYHAHMDFDFHEDTFENVWEKTYKTLESAIVGAEGRAPEVIAQMVERHRKTGYYLPPSFTYSIGSRHGYRI